MVLGAGGALKLETRSDPVRVWVGRWIAGLRGGIVVLKLGYTAVRRGLWGEEKVGRGKRAGRDEGTVSAGYLYLLQRTKGGMHAAGLSLGVGTWK